jgi:hypothetical protein
MLTYLHEFVLSLVAVAGFIFATEIGYRLEVRRRAQTTEAATRHIDALQASVLGLLALLLGFSFAMSSSSFDDRKALFQEEVDAIGTSWRWASFCQRLRRNRSPSC